MFIAVQFFAEYSKSYTYKSKSRRIKIGDFVVVPTPTGNTVAKVVKVKLSTPSFECKEVVKKVEL
jgi:hypothetical protein